MTVSSLSYYLNYSLDCLVLLKKRPLVARISLINTYDSKIPYYVEYKEGNGTASFETIKTWIDSLYEQGIRILYIQGGEPLLWKEDKKDVNHVIEYAHKKGFFQVAVVTEGTISFNHVQSDIIWINLDGTRELYEANNKLEILNTILQNIEDSTAKKIYINTLLTKDNSANIIEFIESITASEKINALSINLSHMLENSTFSAEEKTELLNTIIELKEKAYPILNSSYTLKSIAENNYTEDNFACCFTKDIVDGAKPF